MGGPCLGMIPVSELISYVSTALKCWHSCPCWTHQDSGVFAAIY
jgi:hypothetical protein